jgi:hypothetical protein
MPRKSQYPRLRTHVRKGQAGRVYVYYFYDMRPEGLPDIKLGRDRDAALAKWDEIHNHKPRIKGRIREAIEAWKDQALPTYTNRGTKRNYTANIERVDAVFGMMAWSEVTLPMIKRYLTERLNRKDKTQKAGTTANREISVFQIVWNWARLHGPEGSNHPYTTLPWPAAGMTRSKWKNKEGARRFRVTNLLFDAVYAQAEPMLRDCMDLSTATGMRLTDCRTIELPPDNILHLEANKTGKDADFDLSLSEVLPEMLKRRRALREASDGIDHVRLLTMPDGTEVTESKLRGAYDRARAKAAAKARAGGHEEFASLVEAMWLRDMRKYAANLAGSLSEASELLQHSSEAVTAKHYRQVTLKPVR